MLYHIETFGCQMNENDSLIIGDLLHSLGHQPAGEIAKADIIVINTCCVRETAESRALGFIGSLKHYKELNPGICIAVCGCMAQKSDTAEVLRKKYRHVGVVCGTFAMAQLPYYIEQYLSDGQRIFDVEERYDREDIQRDKHLSESDNNYKAQVNINYGCNNFCSYCIVPYVRGRERSRQPQVICDEIRALVAHGCREIQLLGQNVNSYGHDLEGNWGFARLLEEVSAIEGLDRIRFMTSHPRDFSHHLIDTIAKLPNVCRQFHLPVQAGCNRILQEMNRGYTKEYYREILAHLRENFPDATVTTDLIVGFPGETDEDFAETLEFIAECRFDAAYTFIYSRRSGTPAAIMPDQVPEEVKKQRLQQLMDIQNPISLAQNEKLVGETLVVMTEGPSRTNAEVWSSRSEGGKIVLFPAVDGLQPGMLKKVRIEKAQTWNLSGSLVE